jgi:hypothetical protein
MTTWVALLAKTVNETDPPATTLLALALMVTVGAGVTVGADGVVCEPPVWPLEDDEPPPLPHAERNNSVKSTTHRVKCPQRPAENDRIMTSSCPIQLLFQPFVPLYQPSG